jgi:hypothetical protein
VYIHYNTTNMSGEPQVKTQKTPRESPLGLISTSAKIGGGNNDSLFAKHIYELVKRVYKGTARIRL